MSVGCMQGEPRWIVPPAIFGPAVHARVVSTADMSSTDALPSAAAPTFSPKRRREFAAGRRCAAQALIDAGAQDVEVGVGAAREPRWPAGFVGSITHSAFRAGAAVGPTRSLRAIGIDFEPIFDDEAMRDAAPAALSDAEWRLCSEWSPNELATLVFSAKESLYKCLYPLAATFFDFTDVEVAELVSPGIFRIRLLRDLGVEFVRGSLFEGRFALADGHVHTAIDLRW